MKKGQRISRFKKPSQPHAKILEKIQIQAYGKKN